MVYCCKSTALAIMGEIHVLEGSTVVLHHAAIVGLSCMGGV
jgi:hypothetical protein